MQRMIGAVVALQLCAVPAFAQSTPATTPSSPPVTTPPPAAATPPTGGPNSMPTAEPANVIADDSLTKGAGGSFTEAQAQRQLRDRGYRQVSALTRDRDGTWHGIAERNGARAQVAVDGKGNISSK